MIKGDQEKANAIGNTGDSDGVTNIDGSNDSTERGVSIAYARGGRQPVLHNMANLFQSGVQSSGAFVRGSLRPANGPPSAAGGGDDRDNKNGKNRNVACFCLPFLSCGRGEEGRYNVRLVSTLFFPLFLLSFFVLNDIGRVAMRNMRLRNGAFSSVEVKDEISHPVIRRKVVHQFHGVKRELIWVPLELTLDVDEVTSFEAKMKCPRGILFLFHGCGRYAASFFYSPQGRRLVSLAYKSGVAIVAFEKNDERGCWDWEDDGEVVLKIGKKFVASRLLGACGIDANGEYVHPPIWAFGASSGGSFVAMLAAQMQKEPEKHSPFLFSAINIQIMDPPEWLDWDIPTVFTVMNGDSETEQRVHERVAKKFQLGPFKLIVTSGRKAIHANHFATVFKDDKQMTPAISNEIYQSLVTMGIVDSRDGHLLTDPRQSVDAVESVWQKYDVAARGANLPESELALPFGVSQQMMRPLRADEIHDSNSIWLIEELNVAWDQHELTAEGFEDVLTFFFEFGVPG